MTQDEEQLMVSLDSADEVNEIDTHGGMGGDGYSVTVYSCEEYEAQSKSNCHCFLRT
ncbi:MAG: hypothetical protein ACI4ET_04755 [Bilifractor sp.]